MSDNTEVREVIADLNAGFAKFRAEHAEKVSTLQASVDEMAVKLACKRGYDTAPAGSRLIADALNGDGMRALREGSANAALLPLAVSINDLRAATITTDGYGTAPQFDPRIAGVAVRPLSLIDLLPRIPVTAGAFQYNRVTGAYANAADYQALEGDLKANQDVPMGIIDSPIATIAAMTALSEQVLSDAPALQQQVDNLLLYGTSAKLEGELIAGIGGTGKITGLLTAGTAFVPTTGASNEDAVSECAAHLQSLGFVPSAVLVNPGDFHKLRTSKASGSGEYLAGSWNQPPVPSIWGVPAVVSPSVPAGTAVVMDVAQTALLDRQQVRIDLGRVNDDFQRNTLRVRAELRAGLAVFAPTAVQVVTIA